MAKSPILLVEDSQDIRFLVRAGLEREGYAVREAVNASSAVDYLANGFAPHAILLDLMLSEENGLDFLPSFRKYTDAPIIIVTAKSNLIERVIGLEVGADDYVVKPFQMQELLARIKAHVRRYVSSTREQKENVPAKVQFGNWTLDPERLQLFDESGLSANLTSKEYRLLEVMIASPRKVFSREQLLDKSRGHELNVTDRAIDTQIARINRKLKKNEDDESIIQSVRGEGYYFSQETKIV